MTPQEKRAHKYAKKASLCPGEFDARFESYLQAEKDIISIIESRLSELLGDAQPTPILRAELSDLIKKIEEV